MVSRRLGSPAVVGAVSFVVISWALGPIPTLGTEFPGIDLCAIAAMISFLSAEPLEWFIRRVQFKQGFGLPEEKTCQYN